MLSKSKGFLALENKRHITFDRTLIDIVSKAELGKSKKGSNVIKDDILRSISKIIEGKLVYENDTFYILL